MKKTAIANKCTLQRKILHKHKKIIILSSRLVFWALLIFLIVPYFVTIVFYTSIFHKRYETPSRLAYSITEFDGLQADRYEFQSYDYETLVGYRYYTEQAESYGVVVLAHGFGSGGHNGYMNVAYYFARNGFDVFAYDATGNDESGGKSTKGIPQGLKDLSCAIDFLHEIDELKALPIFLWGHSWGGYAVTTVLNYHPEVKAVVSVAGFNRSSDLLYSQGKEMIGGMIDFLFPYTKSYEKSLFGNYAEMTAMNGFANSDAGVFIVHSKDDTVVPIQYGYDIYYEKYANDKRFVFRQYEDKGHNSIDDNLFADIMNFYKSYR